MAFTLCSNLWEKLESLGPIGRIDLKLNSSSHDSVKQVNVFNLPNSLYIYINITCIKTCLLNRKYY